jgi:formylmethanofuran dehydrogenase subunit E
MDSSESQEQDPEGLLTTEDFLKCTEFHGHTCPGLAIGFRAARILMDRLNLGKARDEELVAIVETDACGADALQVMTGCTFGKGNFVLVNYGKHAFSLVDRKGGKGWRVCLKPEAFQFDRETLSLSETVRKGQASEEEKGRFREGRQERLNRILKADAEALFKIEEISPTFPPKARIVDSGVCDICGELTRVDMLKPLETKRACVPCYRQAEDLRKKV